MGEDRGEEGEDVVVGIGEGEETRVGADEEETVSVATTALLSKTGLESLLPTDEETDVSLYISNLFPAPQYSYWSPGQVNEQSSWFAARTEVASSVLPQ